QVESSSRGIYCGAIGYITPNREAIFNVPIRTVVINHETGVAEYGVGGGITMDSTVEEEYKEVLTKAEVLRTKPFEFHLLESLRLDQGRYFVLEEHMARLKKSATYFNFQIDCSKIEFALQQFANKHKDKIMKVRLFVAKQGEIKLEGQEI